MTLPARTGGRQLEKKEITPSIASLGKKGRRQRSLFERRRGGKKEEESSSQPFDGNGRGKPRQSTIIIQGDEGREKEERLALLLLEKPDELRLSNEFGEGRGGISFWLELRHGKGRGGGGAGSGRRSTREGGEERGEEMLSRISRRSEGGKGGRRSGDVMWPPKNTEGKREEEKGTSFFGVDAEFEGEGWGEEEEDTLRVSAC